MNTCTCKIYFSGSAHGRGGGGEGSVEQIAYEGGEGLHVESFI